MALAIRDLDLGQRDDLCVVLQCYARRPSWVSKSVRKGLEALRLDYADILLLGWHEKPPSERTLDAVEQERENGTFRHLAVSSHQRPLFRRFMEDGRYDVFHVRYNAAHIGAERDLFPYLPGAALVQASGSNQGDGGAAADGSSVAPDAEPLGGDPVNGPGIVAFTVLRWGDLLNPKKMPPGEDPLTAAECYRFALSNPHVHVAITGPKNDDEMRHALEGMKTGPLDEEEMSRVRAIGDHVYRQKSISDWFR
jgi:aryl-alcohol dehydrogenase-like predicted oxidoreductase